MAKRVEYSREAVKTLLRIDRATSRRIRQKVDQLVRNPEALANNVSALKGGEDPDRISFVHSTRVVQRRMVRFVAIPPSGPESVS